MSKCKMFFRILTTPSCWIRNYRTNKFWDKKINQCLDNPCFSSLSEHAVMLNGMKIWIENHPYASVRDVCCKKLGMPSRATVFRFYDALQKYRADSLSK